MKEDKSPVTKFRRELNRIMPGYTWTIRRTKSFDTSDSKYLEAEGIRSAGFNRLSTLRVIRRERAGVIEYEVASSGFGKKARWLATHSGATLASALRGLQTRYEDTAYIYSKHARDLEAGRRSVAEKTKEGQS